MIGKKIWFNKLLSEELVKLYKWINGSHPPDSDLDIKILKYQEIPENFTMRPPSIVSSLGEIYSMASYFSRGEDEHSRQKALNIEILLGIYKRWSHVVFGIGVLAFGLNLYLTKFLINSGKCLIDGIQKL